eukprot:6195652-Pleurochrysis_carterae.AAC.2
MVCIRDHVGKITVAAAVALGVYLYRNRRIRFPKSNLIFGDEDEQQARACSFWQGCVLRLPVRLPLFPRSHDAAQMLGNTERAGYGGFMRARSIKRTCSSTWAAVCALNWA